MFQEKKLPKYARLPPVLIFDMSSFYNTGKEIEPESILAYGGHVYELIAVVFGGGNHFNCRVKLSGAWYDYDDLANVSKKKPELLLVGTGRYGVQAKSVRDPFKTTTKRVVSYRYVRTAAFHSRPTCNLIPVDPDAEYNDNEIQFEDMCAVLDGETI